MFKFQCQECLDQELKVSLGVIRAGPREKRKEEVQSQFSSLAAAIQVLTTSKIFFRILPFKNKNKILLLTCKPSGTYLVKQ
ncbi:hypothetical protein Y1Q_0020887 [Alligator mississippiensis]|uniref:Uncharacterized protein n=1 Tax=Alligator mississippiensis TaxID=8496 RepID=A0A151NJC6_ALLMI|nr:hypothetical protein Y1Q_0020887 [Alligator mississippiensis]